MTFVVPTNNGCNLKCPYCLVNQRGERDFGAPRLSIEDYRHFADSICRHGNIGWISVQGDEPLLPESVPYTRAILEAGRQNRLPTSFVTNGINLEDNLAWIIHSGVSNLAVSLDGWTAQVHDKLRGVPGAFNRTLAGLRRAQAKGLEGRLLVSSVLLPGKVQNLLGMAKFLASEGLYEWYVSPYIEIGKNGARGGFKEGDSALIKSLSLLKDEAKEANVSLYICDDFEELCKKPGLSASDFTFKSDGRSGILRLLPNGACPVGEEILSEHSPTTPVWDPKKEAPYAFYQRVRN